MVAGTCAQNLTEKIYKELLKMVFTRYTETEKAKLNNTWLEE